MDRGVDVDRVPIRLGCRYVRDDSVSATDRVERTRGTTRQLKHRSRRNSHQPRGPHTPREVLTRQEVLNSSCVMAHRDPISVLRAPLPTPARRDGRAGTRGQRFVQISHHCSSPHHCERGPHAWREVLTAFRVFSLQYRAYTQGRPASRRRDAMPFPSTLHPRPAAERLEVAIYHVHAPQ